MYAYNRNDTSSVYVLTDDQKRIIKCDGGYSTPPDLTGFIKIDEGTGDKYNLCQSHYFKDGLYTMDGIPLYKYINGEIIQRTDGEIKQDRLPNTIQSKKQEIRNTCHNKIVDGFDIGNQHFSLEETDQLNLTTAAAAIKDGASSYPYHADGESCRIYTASEINAIVKAATFHKLYHTTLCNHLLQQLNRVTEYYQLLAIDYSPEALSEDLKGNFTNVINASKNL